MFADLTVVLHFGFVLFVVLGGLVMVRWPRGAWAHVPAARPKRGVSVEGQSRARRRTLPSLAVNSRIALGFGELWKRLASVCAMSKSYATRNADWSIRYDHWRRWKPWRVLTLKRSN